MVMRLKDNLYLCTIKPNLKLDDINQYITISYLPYLHAINSLVFKHGNLIRCYSAISKMSILKCISHCQTSALLSLNKYAFKSLSLVVACYAKSKIIAKTLKLVKPTHIEMKIERKSLLWLSFECH